MRKPYIGLTGATGFVGRNLINRLLSEKYKVKALVLENDHKLPSEVGVVKGNLITGEGIGDFVKDIDVLLHLAARVTEPESEMFEANSYATYKLVENLLKSNVHYVIFMSSVAVYGSDANLEFKESDSCNPDTIYGLSKLLAENILKFWQKKSGKKLTILRPFNIYGPGNKKGIIYSFCKSIKENDFVEIFGEGNQTRDFLYIDDLVELILKILTRKKQGTYNIGSDNKYSINQVVGIFEDIYGRKIKKVYKNNEMGKVYNINQSLESVKETFGWRSTTSFRKGLEQTLSNF